MGRDAIELIVKPTVTTRPPARAAAVSLDVGEDGERGGTACHRARTGPEPRPEAQWLWKEEEHR
jgi:hypothetical protein